MILVISSSDQALALRWRDVDLDAARIAVRRSVGTVKHKGAGEELDEGPTKTGQSRIVDLDAGTVTALRAYRTARGGVSPGHGCPVDDSTGQAEIERRRSAARDTSALTRNS
jgi:integrase